MNARRILSVVLVVLVATPIDAAIRPTWPIEFAVERAQLVVIGERGKLQGDYSEVRVTEVLYGSAAKVGDTILVFNLAGYETLYRPDPFERKKDGIDLEAKPVLLCLAQAVSSKEKGRFDLQKTGHGSALKILDGFRVYGYYQWMNPGPYSLTRESCTKKEMLARIPRAIAMAKKWADVKAIADQLARESKMVEFLMDRDLPSHFCFQACADLRNARLIAIIEDELKHAKPIPPKPRLTEEEKLKELLMRRREAVGPDASIGWPRLSCALMFVEDDAKSLLPLLIEIKRKMPEYHSSAVRCAARKCGPDAIPFLQEALQDLDGEHEQRYEAAYGLIRLGTPEACAALENALEKRFHQDHWLSWDVTRMFAEKWPARWSALAEKLHRDFDRDEKAQKCLDDSWVSLVRVNVVKVDVVPKRYTAKYEPIIARLGSETFRVREAATHELKALLAKADDGPIVRGLLQKAAQAGESSEIRHRAAYLLSGARE